ncbi:hypothetical protein JCM11251_002952 [Rhodosporidiobolus azoricus]
MGHSEQTSTSVSIDWLPPSPRSQFDPLPTPTLPVDHLVLLPPPILPRDAHRNNDDDHSQFRPLLPTHRPSLPSLAPLLNPSPPPDDHPTMNESLFPLSQEQKDAQLAAALSSEAASSRPRRAAAIIAGRNIPRQPSPFDLAEGDEDPYAEGDEEDALSMSPPPSGSGSRKRAGTGSTSGAGGSEKGGPSKRKVSHSLIERRRREKINVCLQTLRETVPSLKEEGEKKMAKARERGKKRGRGDDSGERGGLHKLEILQGTILYIEELRARITQLEGEQAGNPAGVLFTASSTNTPADTATSYPAPPSYVSSSGLSGNAPSPSPPSFCLTKHQQSTSSGPFEPPPLPLPSPLLRASISSALAASTSFPPLTASHPAPSPPIATGGSMAPSDHEAGMLLLNFSTSPELRPVQM